MDFKPPKYEKFPKPDPPPRAVVLSARIVGDEHYAALVIKWQKGSGHGPAMESVIDLEVPRA